MRHLAWLPIAVVMAFFMTGCGPDEAISAFQVGHVAEAKAMFQQALSRNPADPDALYYMGRIACVEQDWESACYYFQCCIDADPSFPTARQWFIYAEKSAGVNLRFIPIPPQRR